MPTTIHLRRTVRGGEHVRLVLILGALTAVGPLSVDAYLPALPALSRELSAGTFSVQLSLSACLVGLAIGQITAGPISDALGRRRPLLVGTALHTLASLLCAVALFVEALMILRLAQGLAGAAGIVIARAVVADVSDGVTAARLLALLMVVAGAAPVLAPVVGGQLLRVAPWRGVFAGTAGLGALLFVAVLPGLRETLPPAKRQTGGLRTTLRNFAWLATDRAFVGYALSGGLAFAAMFAYIAGSPFVLQDVHGLSPQGFSLVFALNADRL